MRDYYCTMEADKFYHVFNRGNNKSNLFYKPENYKFFLRRYDEYLSPYINTYAYSLMPNHFHFLVQVKSDEEVMSNFLKRKEKPLEGKQKPLREVSALIGYEKEKPFGKVSPLISCEKQKPFEKVSALTGDEKQKPFKKVSALSGLTTSEIISNRFQAFFTSYSMAINKQEKRSGALFLKPFKRVFVDSTQYFSRLVFYIHANPQLHGIIDDFRHYPWNSYEGIISSKPTKLKRDSILEWFDDRENYISYHTQIADLDDIRNLLIE